VFPEEAIRSDGGGSPRSSGYWLTWNTCTEANQSDVAIANGGADEGWYLMDDILSHPGVSVGDHVIESCMEGAAVLAVEDRSGESMWADVAYVLASQLLSAELNVNIGTESCPAIEEAMVAGHVLLSTLGFDGSGNLPSEYSDENRESARRITDLLNRYNAGELCI
jgi:hypothetical protein